MLRIFATCMILNVLAFSAPAQSATECLELKGQSLSDVVDCVAAQSDEYILVDESALSKSNLYQRMANGLLYDIGDVQEAKRTYALWGDWLLSQKSKIAPLVAEQKYSSQKESLNQQYANQTLDVARGLATTGDLENAKIFVTESFTFVEDVDIGVGTAFLGRSEAHQREVVQESTYLGLGIDFALDLVADKPEMKKRWLEHMLLGLIRRGETDKAIDFFNNYPEIQKDGILVRLVEKSLAVGQDGLAIEFANRVTDDLDNCEILTDAFLLSSVIATDPLKLRIRISINEAESIYSGLLQSGILTKLEDPKQSRLAEKYTSSTCPLETGMLNTLGRFKRGNFEIQTPEDALDELKLLFAASEAKLAVGDYLGARKAVVDASSAFRKVPDDSRPYSLELLLRKRFREHLVRSGELKGVLGFYGADDLTDLKDSQVLEIGNWLNKARMPELAFSIIQTFKNDQTFVWSKDDTKKKFFSEVPREASIQLASRTDFDQSSSAALSILELRGLKFSEKVAPFEHLVKELAKNGRHKEVGDVAETTNQYANTNGAQMVAFWKAIGDPQTPDLIQWHECDNLAASVGDRDSLNNGNMYAELNASAAVVACAEAVAQFPLVPQYQYQYGRALLKADRGKEAVSWLRKAANSGSAAAAQSLGIMYLNGMSLPQNDFLAAKWLFQAATEGHIAGQSDLAYLYHTGRGVTQNNTLALRYASLSAAQGWQPAKDLLKTISQQSAQSPNTPAASVSSEESDQSFMPETPSSNTEDTTDNAEKEQASNEALTEREDMALLSQPPEPVTIADVIPFAFNAGVYRAWAELCVPEEAKGLRAQTLEAYRARWSEAPVYGTLEADEAFFVKTMDEQYNKQKQMTKNWEGQGTATVQICNEPNTKNTINQTRTAYEELYAKWRVTQ